MLLVNCRWHNQTIYCWVLPNLYVSIDFILDNHTLLSHSFETEWRKTQLIKGYIHDNFVTDVPTSDKLCLYWATCFVSNLAKGCKICIFISLFRGIWTTAFETSCVQCLYLWSHFLTCWLTMKNAFFIYHYFSFWMFVELRTIRE